MIIMILCHDTRAQWWRVGFTLHSRKKRVKHVPRLAAQPDSSSGRHDSSCCCTWSGHRTGVQIFDAVLDLLRWKKHEKTEKSNKNKKNGGMHQGTKEIPKSGTGEWSCDKGWDKHVPVGQRVHIRSYIIYIYIYIHTHIHIYVCMCECMNVRMYKCMHACMHACMYVWYIWYYIYTHLFMYLSIDLSIYLFIYMYLISIYIYTHIGQVGQVDVPDRTNCDCDFLLSSLRISRWSTIDLGHRSDRLRSRMSLLSPWKRKSIPTFQLQHETIKCQPIGGNAKETHGSPNSASRYLSDLVSHWELVHLAAS